MHLLQKSKVRNASKEERRIKESRIRHTRLKEIVQSNSVKTKSLHAGEYVRSLKKFSKMNITIL